MTSLGLLSAYPYFQQKSMGLRACIGGQLTTTNMYGIYRSAAPTNQVNVLKYEERGNKGQVACTGGQI